MKTRILSSLISVLMLISLLPMMAGAASMADVPKSIEAPQNVAIVTDEIDGEFIGVAFNYSGGANIRKFLTMNEDGTLDELGINSLNFDMQIDFKFDNDPWQYKPSWDWTVESSGDAPYWLEAGAEPFVGDFYIHPDDLKPQIETMDDFNSKTIYVRGRYIVTYYSDNTDESTVLTSPWSEIAIYGKDAVVEKVTSVEPPVLKKVELKKDGEGVPYFEITVDNPESVKKLLNGSGYIVTVFGMRIAGGEWSESGSSADMLWEIYNAYPNDSGSLGEINIEANVYEFRLRYEYRDSDYEVTVNSPYSNVLTLGTPAFYKNASSWAKADLNRAAEYGFITDNIKDNMKAPITREEFAEIAVKLYEKYTGKTSTYTDMNAFVDTQNPEIFKAYNLGIVKGTNLEQKLYSPKNYISREQMAVMLYRAVMIIKPDTDFSTAGAESFADEKLISNWALESVKFMSKNGLIKGSGGNFDPKGTTTREMAVVIAVRVYEKYAGISN